MEDSLTTHCFVSSKSESPCHCCQTSIWT